MTCLWGSLEFDTLYGLVVAVSHVLGIFTELPSAGVWNRVVISLGHNVDVCISARQPLLHDIDHPAQNVSFAITQISRHRLTCVFAATLTGCITSIFGPQALSWNGKGDCGGMAGRLTCQLLGRTSCSRPPSQSDPPCPQPASSSEAQLQTERSHRLVETGPAYTHHILCRPSKAKTSCFISRGRSPISISGGGQELLWKIFVGG